MAGSAATILVVEDEPDIADIYADSLRDDYDVVIASSGHRVLEPLDESIDVVLLDRRIPDIHWADILERIRGRDLSCRVAIVTAVEPQFDSLDMGFEDYLVKPVSVESLHAMVARLVARDATIRPSGPTSRRFESGPCSLRSIRRECWLRVQNINSSKRPSSGNERSSILS